MKFFQSLIYQIRDIIDSEFGILDDTGLVLACSDESKAGQNHPLAPAVLESQEQYMSLQSITFQKVYVRNRLEFITYIASDDRDSLKYLSLISINVLNIKKYHEEKFDKSNLIKNIITGNILPGDTSIRAKELHIPYNMYRVVYIVKTGKANDVHSHEIIRSLFPNKTKDFVIVLDDDSTALIKELKSGDDYREIDKTARVIIDTLNTESMVKAIVGIGTVVDNIKDIYQSFKEAEVALTVGSIFESDKPIINYNNLGIGRLIYQLPANSCKLFLDEIFKEGSYDFLDTETLLTVQKFFENNLNVSETSRQLYVHRNTLVYRLDKIQKLTGLDLRKFDDAITFKVSMLVKRYLEKSPDETAGGFL